MTVTRAIRTVAAASAVTISLTAAATASTLPGYGTYDLSNAYPHHGLWLPGLITNDSDYTTEWGIVSGTAEYVEGDGGPNQLHLSGNVQNKGNDDYTLSFSFKLHEIEHTGDPACPHSGDSGCNLQGAEYDDKRDGVRYFDFPGHDSVHDDTMASIWGTGALEGLTLDLSIKPENDSKPPQFGWCANWVDCELGYSNWFFYTASTDDEFNSNIHIASGTKHGDINVNMAPVPLPAAGWMLIAGMGAIGAMRRRRRTD